MAKYKAAVIQLNSNADPSANLAKAGELIRNAVDKGAKLIGLPENFSFLGSEKEKLECGAEIQRLAENFLGQTSREHHIHLLGGGYPVPTVDGKVFNTAALYGPEGKEIFRYYKVHLFDTDPGDGVEYRESRSVDSGKEPSPIFFSSDLGNISTVICYDLRFPELFRVLVSKGAEIIFVPSAFTKLTGIAHWEPLLRARAIENFCYILAPAQTGLHGTGRETYGHSMIVSPWGEILSESGIEEGIIYADIDTEEIMKARKKIPSLKHRKFVAAWEK
ncbi:hydrolase, carbon-nitrogen family [Leptospira broomii serovar Hurstbridge str. 5399]|uniref:Hydrolase, carbon-nitrogen family n=1 Tax=Leptospira broomii serovar Hurstbridge str. 5399 TaxID=1049789 RepID=T0GFR2_9LEPT|nr:carbon-nitrogen hydrolase family protein [Leptospira broomii]EQA45669.1 hydrolase, carbon-nitrogen family [Leptospira broomii serovar Hurstbridge str. 5399]